MSDYTGCCLLLNSADRSEALSLFEYATLTELGFVNAVRALLP